MRKTSLHMVHELAMADARIVFIGSDLSPGLLESMKAEMPDRFFMEGISEQHIIGMAAGLAMSGFLPYVHTIATFLTRRCYEQVALDLCLQNLPVRLIAIGGGGVYAPLGPTHLAVEDFAIMRALPNMTILAPCDADEMRRLMVASVKWPHPMYIRLAKGEDRIVSRAAHGFEIGQAILMQEPGEGLFITTGVMTQLAIEAIKKLATEDIVCGLLHCHTVKPLDYDKLQYWIPKVNAVVSVEEHIRNGGMGSAVMEYCCDEISEHAFKLVRVGIPDRFADQYGTQDTLLSHWGLTVDTICHAMRTKLRKN